MAKNDFKPFATGKQANVTEQKEWETRQELLQGFQSGRASSAQINKALRQGTSMASVLAGFIAELTNADVIDDGDIQKLIKALHRAIEKKSSLSIPIGTTAGTVAAGDDKRIDNALDKNKNLSDIKNVTETRKNLGLGKLATKDTLVASDITTGKTAGTVAAGDDSRIVNAVDKSKNLSDLNNITEVRKNLGLGKLATKDSLTATDVTPLIGTTSGTVAAGDDKRIDNALDKNKNLSDLKNITETRKNLGLGKLAIKDSLTAKEVAALPITGGVLTGEITTPKLNLVNKENPTGTSVLADGNIIGNIWGNNLKTYLDNIRGLIFGVDQAWENVSHKRFKNIVYTNTTNKPIVVNIYAIIDGNNAPWVKLYVSDLLVAYSLNRYSAYEKAPFVTAIVPPMVTYMYDHLSGAKVTIMEMR